MFLETENSWTTSSEIISKYKEDMKREPSAKEILEYLIDWRDYDHTFVLKKEQHHKSTPLQRLNSLWVIPLYLLTVAPFFWIIKGNTGLRYGSRLRALLGKMTGNV